MRGLFDWFRGEDKLRRRSVRKLATGAAHFLAEVNAIHPFREGNGRTQNVFLYLIGEHAGHPLDFEPFEPARVLGAMMAAMAGDESDLAALIHEMCLA